jgi:oligoendopeptidase F
MFTNQFTFKLKIDGKTETITRDQLSSYFSSPSPELRAAAYQELYRVYIENSTVLAQMYIHRARDWHTEGMELRGFTSPISARNVENDLPDEVVETLLAVCRKNANIFQRYFKMKAQWLGLDQLRRYDIYAPLTPSDKNLIMAQPNKWSWIVIAPFRPKLRNSRNACSMRTMLIQKSVRANVAAHFVIPRSLN